MKNSRKEVWLDKKTILRLSVSAKLSGYKPEKKDEIIQKTAFKEKSRNAIWRKSYPESVDTEPVSLDESKERKLVKSNGKWTWTNI
jgi:hypothetical protein